MKGTPSRNAWGLFSIVAICHVALPAAGAEWPQFRGPHRDGKSPETGLLKEWPEGGPKLVWKATGIGDGYSSVAVSEGGIYVSGKVGDELVLTSFDLAGKRGWRVVHGPAWTKSYPGSRSTPVVDGASVYLFSGFGILNRFDAGSGEEKWSVDVVKDFGASIPRYGYAETPLIHKGRIVVTPGGANCMVALDKLTGKVVWKSSGLDDPPAHGSAILFEFGGVEMIANMTAKGIACVSASDGRFLWRNTRPAKARRLCTPPVYHDGYVFGATGYGSGGACVKLVVEGETVRASQVWETKDMDCHHGGYVVVGGKIYGNHKRGWNCLDLKTGEKLWGEQLVGKGSVSYADGMLYLLAERGGRVGLAAATPEAPSLSGDFAIAGSKKPPPPDPAKPRRRRVRSFSWAHPSISGGRLYLRFDDNLYCFDTRAGEE